MLGEAGGHGLVLLSALDLLQQPLPRQKGNSGNTAHLDFPPLTWTLLQPGASRASGSQHRPEAGRALRETAFSQCAPPWPLLRTFHPSTHTPGHASYSSSLSLGVSSFQTACPDPPACPAMGSHSALASPPKHLAVGLDAPAWDAPASASDWGLPEGRAVPPPLVHYQHVIGAWQV